MHSRWPARLQLVYDAQPALGPLHEDLRELADQIARLLGPRIELFVVEGLPGRWTDAKGQSVPAPAAGAAMLVLGDAGLMQADPVHAARWCAFARDGAAAGLPAAAVGAGAPPPGTARHRVGVRHRAARRRPGDAHRALRPAAGQPGRRRRRAAAAGTTRRQSRWRPRRPRRWRRTWRRCARRSTANPWVTPALLRSLRLTLQAHGHALDVASEAELWQDPGVSANELACTLQGRPARHGSGRLRRPAEAAARRAGGAALAAPAGRPRRCCVPSTHARCAHCSPASPPATRCGSASRRASPLPPSCRAAFVGCWPGGPAPWRRPWPATSAAWASGGRSRVAGDDEALQAAWALAHRQALAEGRIAPLPGLDSARVAWALVRDDADTRRFVLALLGLPGQGGNGSPRWALRMHEAAAAAPAPAGGRCCATWPAAGRRCGQRRRRAKPAATTGWRQTGRCCWRRRKPSNCATPRASASSSRSPSRDGRERSASRPATGRRWRPMGAG
jgi:hypothetical protein